MSGLLAAIAPALNLLVRSICTCLMEARHDRMEEGVRSSSLRRRLRGRIRMLLADRVRP
jgi:hypothetical protein